MLIAQHAKQWYTARMSNFLAKFRNGDIFPWERAFTREVSGVAVPIMIQSLLAASLHIVDNLMIGQLGEIELAAVAQANRITFLFQLFIFGLVSGTSAFTAQYWGKRDIAGIRRVMGVALLFSLGVVLLFAIPGVAISQSVMRLLLKDENAVICAGQYLRIICFGFLFTAISQCFGSVQKSTEQARLPMVGGVVAIALNTFLNYCLIFGNLGFPKLGVQGGALATVIAAFADMLIVVVGGYLFRFATAAKLSELVPRSLAFIRRYLTIALPVVLNEGLWSLGMVMYSVVFGRMGTGAVAAMSIFDSVQNIAFAFTRGSVHACAVVAGKRIGAGNEDGAQQACRRLLCAQTALGLLAGLIIIAIAGPITRLFNVSDAVRGSARTLLIFGGIFMWANALAGALIVGVMRAGGDVRYSLYLDVGSVWLIGVPIVAVCGLLLGLPIEIVYTLSYAESLFKIIVGLRRFQSRSWIHNLTR